MTTESAMFDRLCEDIGHVCDAWQEGRVNDQRFIRLMTAAAEKWLTDQKKHTPKAALKRAKAKSEDEVRAMVSHHENIMRRGT